MKERPIKILYISQYFPPEMGAPSARVYELSRRWAAQGNEVTVLTAFPNHPNGIIPEEYQGLKYLKEEKDGIRVIRTYIYAAPNKGFLRRSFSYFSFALSAVFLGTGKVGKPDVIIGTSPQFFVVVAAYIISKIKGAPFVFELRDFWPESIVQLGLLKNRLIIRILEAVEMHLYHKAAHIIGVVDSFKTVLMKRGIAEDKISIIKNGVDLDLFRNIFDQDALKTEIDLKGKFVIGYIGTHGLAHALDKVLEAANLLKEEEDIHFLFVGDGAKKEELVQKSRQLNLPNVTFKEKATKKEVVSYYALTDALLVSLRKIDLFLNALPSKLFEIMAMNKPILLSVDGEARQLIESIPAGLFAEPENPKDLVAKILYLKEHPEEQKQFGNNGRQFVIDHFNRKELADQYLEILKNIILAY